MVQTSFYHSRASIQQLKNMNSSFKSPFSPQELPNLSEDTNIKRLKTWNCRSNQFLDFENIQIPSKSLHQSCHLPQFSCRHCIARHWPQSYSVASTLASAQITKKLRDQEKGHPSYVNFTSHNSLLNHMFRRAFMYTNAHIVRPLRAL